MNRSIIIWTPTRRILVLAAGASALLSCAQPEAFHITPTPDVAVRCHVARRECLQLGPDGGCAAFGLQRVSFDATACGPILAQPDDVCLAAFCDSNGTDGPFFRDCSATGGNLQADGPGLCSPNLAATDESHVAYDIRETHCNAAGGCSVVTIPRDECLPVTKQKALATIAAATDHILKSSRVVIYEANTACTKPPNEFSLALPPGRIGTATAGGTSTALTLVDGFMDVGEDCYGESCYATSIRNLRANAASFTVSGVPVTNVTISQTIPAPITTDSAGNAGVAAGDLQLMLRGRIAGQPMFLRADNTDTLALGFGSNGVRLSGGFDFRGVRPGGQVVPVDVNVDVTATPATPAQQACASESTQQQLFGFESADSWASTQANLSETTSPVTQGCEALSVSGQNYMTITGAPFSARTVTPQASLSVDLFIPDHQPNPYWLGALQMYLSCPSGAVNNVYIGQVDLTGKPQDRYSTLRFPLPAAVASALRRPLDDCSFSFGLNVNQTGRAWLLDNLRFTP